MTDLSKYNEDFFLFLEGGFIAINQADEDAAVKLFNACKLLQPKNFLIKIGIGYLHLHKLELKSACQYFQEVLQEDPNNDIAQALLAISLSFTPDKTAKGEKILTKLSQTSSDTQVKNVANTALNFIDNFIKNRGPASSNTSLHTKH